MHAIMIPYDMIHTVSYVCTGALKGQRLKMIAYDFYGY